jgi:hypothetical protein
LWQNIARLFLQTILIFHFVKAYLCFHRDKLVSAKPGPAQAGSGDRNPRIRMIKMRVPEALKLSQNYYSFGKLRTGSE